MVVKLKSLSRREDCNQEVTLRWLWVFLGGAHSCLTTTGGLGHAKAVEWMGVKNQVETLLSSGALARIHTNPTSLTALTSRVQWKQLNIWSHLKF